MQGNFLSFSFVPPPWVCFLAKSSEWRQFTRCLSSTLLVQG